MIHLEHARWRGDMHFGRSGQYLGVGCPNTRLHLFRERRMSVQALSWVIDHSKHKANPFVVLLMIANHARSDGSGAWPSIRTLAKECRLAERTVQRSLVSLAKSGELRVARGKGPYGSNLYDLPGVKLTPPGVNLSVEGCQIDRVGVSQVSPNPSFNRPEDKEELFQLIRDYHNGKTYTDENGKQYKISPSSRKKIYVTS